MEGVGARLGRSSTRYGGPATVFTGPVRKWQKKWVQVQSPNNNNNNNNSSSAKQSSAGGGGANSNSSHLVLYKWTPLTSSNGNGGSATPAVAAAGGDGDKEPKGGVAAEEPAPRKFRYVPISVLEEQKQEAAAKIDDEAKPTDNEASPKMQNKNQDSEPGTTDVPMEEAEASGKDQTTPPEANHSNLDLSLGLKAHEGSETDSKSTT